MKQGLTMFYSYRLSCHALCKAVIEEASQEALEVADGTELGGGSSHSAVFQSSQTPGGPKVRLTSKLYKAPPSAVTYKIALDDPKNRDPNLTPWIHGIF